MIGLNLGISEGCLLVALIPLVPKEGKYEHGCREELTNLPLDQSQLYAFFDLTIALAGDMGIAISLAVTHALIKSNLVSVLGDSPPTKDVSFPIKMVHLISSYSTILTDNSEKSREPRLRSSAPFKFASTCRSCLYFIYRESLWYGTKNISSTL